MGEPQFIYRFLDLAYIRFRYSRSDYLHGINTLIVHCGNFRITQELLIYKCTQTTF